MKDGIREEVRIVRLQVKGRSFLYNLSIGNSKKEG